MAINVLRMMAVHNEADTLQRNIDWYHERGFPTVVLDNASTDESYAICERARRAGKILDLVRFATDAYECDLIFAELFELAKSKQPDWLMLCAPDEFFEVADGEDLMSAMQTDIARGYNLIKFFNMEFWMTPKDDPNESDPLKRMRYYSCYDVEMYRAFPNIEGADLLRYYGHRPRFPAGVADNPSPCVYVSRHYKIRSVEQGRRKIKRVRPTERLPGCNTHYLQYTGEASQFIVPAERLHRYREDHQWKFECVYNGNRALCGDPKLDSGYWDP